MMPFTALLHHDYLEQTEMVDDTRMQQYLRLADVYLNRYLIASHPETLTSDLTAPRPICLNGC